MGRESRTDGRGGEAGGGKGREGTGVVVVGGIDASVSVCRHVSVNETCSHSHAYVAGPCIYFVPQHIGISVLCWCFR